MNMLWLCSVEVIICGFDNTLLHIIERGGR